MVYRLETFILGPRWSIIIEYQLKLKNCMLCIYLDIHENSLYKSMVVAQPVTNDKTAAEKQSVGAFASHAEGWEFESQPRQT